MKIIEIFESLQGEGPKIGIPSIFLRLCGCNMKCKFNCSSKEDEEKLKYFWGQEVEAVEHGAELKDLRLLDKGCDSYPAIIPEIYNKIAKDYSIEELAQKIVSSTTQCVILTGGEPLIHFREILELKNKVEEIIKNDLIYCITKKIQWCFETNGILPIEDKFGEGFFFVISPKFDYMSEEQKSSFFKNLEYIEKLVLPENFISFKFVVQDEKDLEILVKKEKWILENRKLIYIMPQGSQLDEDFLNRSKNIAEKCIKLGLNFTPRLQNYLWKNDWGK